MSRAIYNEVMHNKWWILAIALFMSPLVMFQNSFRAFALFKYTTLLITLLNAAMISAFYLKKRDHILRKLPLSAAQQATVRISSLLISWVSAYFLSLGFFMLMPRSMSLFLSYILPDGRNLLLLIISGMFFTLAWEVSYKIRYQFFGLLLAVVLVVLSLPLFMLEPGMTLRLVFNSAVRIAPFDEMTKLAICAVGLALCWFLYYKRGNFTGSKGGLVPGR